MLKPSDEPVWEGKWQRVLFSLSTAAASVPPALIERVGSKKQDERLVPLIDIDEQLLAASRRDRPERLARLIADIPPAMLDMRRQNDHRSRRGIELIVPGSNAV